MTNANAIPTTAPTNPDFIYHFQYSEGSHDSRGDRCEGAEELDFALGDRFPDPVLKIVNTSRYSESKLPCA